MKLVVLAALSMAMLATANAADKSNISAEHEKCVDAVDLGALKNSQFGKCNEEELARLDVKLNSHYKKARARMSEEEKKALTQAQRDWLKFRESSCKFWEIQDVMAPNGYHGLTSCMVEMTDKRVTEIAEMAE